MKFLHCIAAFGCLVFSELSAQSDTSFITTHTETGVMERTIIQDRYAELFGSMQPMRWTFKWSPIARTRFDLLNIGVECKLNPAWSLNVDYDPQSGFISYSDDFFDSDFLVKHTLRVELRHYYNMKRRIKAGISANNISGNYIGLEALTSFQQTNQSGFNSSNGIALRLGMQRRFMQRFFFDLGTGIGWQSGRFRRSSLSSTLSPWYRRVYISPQLTGGILFGNIPPKGEAATHCDALRCFEEENSMLKLDMTGIFALFIPVGINAGLGVEYERKLGNSPTSISIGGNTTYTGYNLQQVGELRGYNLGAGAEFRYYYTQQKRMATGKSGNNLNGVYLGFNTGFARSHNAYTYIFPTRETQRIQRERFSFGPLYGLQQRIFKHGFIDLGLGINAKHTNTVNTDSKELNSTVWSWGLVGRMRAGFAF